MFENIKKGDIVIVRCGKTEYLAEAYEITPDFFKAGFDTFRKVNGLTLGYGYFDFIRASIPTDEDFKRIKEQQTINNLTDCVRMFCAVDLNNLSLVQLESLVKTIKELKKFAINDIT
ncbi:MAG: hypothetical protein Q4G42_03540 [Neisseria sp.]|nr:hypothetical protein [Neisseria sp.]